MIATHSDTLRYSLQALLAGLPQIESVQSAQDSAALLAMVQAEPPRVIVLDIDLAGETTAEVLRQIKALAPRTQLVLLIDRLEQQDRLAGMTIDRVILKGYRAADLFASVERLLRQDEGGRDYV